jgi:peptide/nickel transport system ATP-binding protein
MIGADQAPTFSSAPLIEVQALTKDYSRKRLFSKPRITRALDKVDFHLERASATALIGASGSGKSTLARCMVGLERPTSGSIRYDRRLTQGLAEGEQWGYRRKIHMVFQEPATTINPRFTAEAAVSEPLRIGGIGNRRERREAALYWMGQLGLPAEYAERPALRLSGGERQRLAIARALISRPEAIIFDESFSALDLPLARRVLALLTGLRQSQNLTCLFIGHDLAIVAQICSEIAVMYAGRIVERECMQTFLRSPAHGYSRKLLRSIPCPPPGWPA